MFERFTDRARRAIVLAQEEARLLNHNYIGTEHVLLGLIHEDEGGAARALESVGVSLERTRNEVEEVVGKGTERPSGHIPFTPRAKRVLELTLREATRLAADSLDTEHILLGLLREGEGVGVQVLMRLGVDPSTVRVAVESELQGSQLAVDELGAGFQDVLRCSFCSKLQSDVQKLVAGPGVYICDECVARAQSSSHENRSEEEKCSFCGKASKKVEWLYGEGTTICNECVDLCEKIIAEGQKEPIHAEFSASATVTDVLEVPPVPRCVRCRADLLETARCRSIDVPNDSGEGSTKSMAVYCGSCGEVLAVKIMPEET